MERFPESIIIRGCSGLDRNPSRRIAALKQQDKTIIDDTRDALGDFISKSVSAMVKMQNEHHESLKSMLT